MRSSHNSQFNLTNLNNYLLQIGIQPHVFSFFLVQFVTHEKKVKNKTAIRLNLSKVLIAQADLIQYHLTRGA